MTRLPDKINIGDVQSGNIAIGSRVGRMTATASSEGSTSDQAATEPSGLATRLGFVVDVVGYGRRAARPQRDIEERLLVLVDGMVAGAGVRFDMTDSKASGDGMAVFFPAGIDPTRVLPNLLMATANELAGDNERYRDRMRLRMAIASGVIGTGPTGLTGPLIVDLNRLVDSAPLRQAIERYPNSDVVVLASATLHDNVIRPGYVDPALGSFQQVEVAVKEFAATAWLWLPPPPSGIPASYPKH